MHLFAHLNCVNKIVSLLKTNKNIFAHEYWNRDRDDSGLPWGPSYTSMSVARSPICFNWLQIFKVLFLPSWETLQRGGSIHFRGLSLFLLVCGDLCFHLKVGVLSAVGGTVLWTLGLEKQFLSLLRACSLHHPDAWQPLSSFFSPASSCIQLFSIPYGESAGPECFIWAEENDLGPDEAWNPCVYFWAVSQELLLVILSSLRYCLASPDASN